MTASSPARRRAASVRRILLLRVFLLLAPIILFRAWLFVGEYRERREAELQSNLEMARATAASFQAFIGDLRREEKAVGQALAQLSADTRAQASAYLAAVQREYPQVESVTWLRPDGRAVAASTPRAARVPWSQRPWFRTLAHGREWVLTDVSRPADYREARVEAATAIRDEAGRLRGILVAVVDPNRLDQVITIRRAGGGAVSLTDSTGWLAFRLPEAPAAFADRDWRKQYAAVRRALGGEEAKEVTYAGYQKGYRIIAEVPAGDTGWAAGAGRPEAEALGPVRADIARSAVLFACVALFGVLLATLGAHAITLPLTRLRESARALGTGALDRRVTPEGPSDLRELADVFNRMAQSLQTREQALAREHRRTELLANTAGQLLATSDPLGLVNELCRTVMEFLDCQVFFNFLADESAGRLRLNAYAGVSAETARELEWLDYGVAVCGCVAQEGCRLIAEHIPTTPDPRTELVKGLGVTAYACHPILSGEQVLGTLSFGTTTREAFTEEELSLMKAVTDQVALAVVRQRTAAALREARDRLEVRVEARTAELAQANRALEEEIAERRRAQEAAQAERQRFNDVLETLPVYVVLLTADYRVAFANRFFRERFGESLGRRCFEYLFDRGEPCENCETYTVMKTKGPHHWEWQGPDGRNYDIHDFPFTDTDGAEMIMEVGLDVTEQVRAQEELRATSRYARSLLEASLDPLVTISREGKITDVNAATVEVTGVSREQLLGTDFSDYFTAPEQAREGYRQVFSQGFVIDYPLTIRHRNGRLVDVLYNASVYRDAQGEVLGVFAAARDITERKRAEEEVRRLNTELEERVARRTTQLQAAMQEMEAFTYSVSHDLRAPLRAMDGFSQALVEDYREALAGEGREYLRRIRAASQRMAQLIDDLLLLSRVTRGEMQRTSVDLSRLARTIAAELQETDPTRRVVFDIAGGLTTTGDPRLLEQVLRNLLGNAWKFTGKHSAAHIQVGATEVDGGRAFYVRDDGAGFDMAYADKLFGVFQRLHGMEEFEGTGIGLATVQRIVHRHGGRVWAEGAPEGGATFYFVLEEGPGANALLG